MNAFGIPPSQPSPTPGGGLNSAISLDIPPSPLTGEGRGGGATPTSREA